MLTGSYEHKLDSKGRIVLPARFRGELGNSVVATVGFEGCAVLYPISNWKNFENKLDTLSQFKRATRDLKRAFYSNAKEQEIDANGRVIIPAELREYARIDQDITIVGVQDHLEIWPSEKWKEYSRELPDLAELTELLEGI